jgi:hypothetical protein
MRKIFVVLAVVLTSAVAVLWPMDADAQCAMCRATLESNLANGGSAGKGMNRGIFLILGLPYIMVGVIGYMWYRNRRLENE